MLAQEIIGADYYKDFWQYDPSTDLWTRKADFAGGERYGAVGIGIGNKGFIGTGFNGYESIAKNDFWEYDPVTDIWVKKADFAGTARTYATGFSIGQSAYLGFGLSKELVNLSDLWKFTPSDIVLPLHLISFTAECGGKENILRWITEQELNSSHFDIERSVDGNNFKNIGSVTVGNSSNQNHYSFTDFLPSLTATNYYRLKITDKDGSFTYSNIKSIGNSSAGFSVSITPNIIKSGNINFSIKTVALSSVMLTIINLQGKVLYTQQFTATSGSVNKTISIANFPKGIYLLKALSGKESRTMKFVNE